MAPTPITFETQTNETGDPDAAPQGFGRLATGAPPSFDPQVDTDAASAWFAAHGYVVLCDCLSASELDHLNAFCERTQAERPDAWGLAGHRRSYHRNQGLIFSQPLLDHPELDPYTRHPRSWPVVARALGGAEHVRFSEFNLRETPDDAGIGAMNFHHDAASADRFTREPYLPCDWLCAIHYLTDVTPDTPAFCVVPNSNRYDTLRAAFDALGPAYAEVPLYGPAGTCILYDTALFHTRLDGDGRQGRRTWHQYYARGGWLRSSLPESNRYIRPPSPALTNWNLFPERLALNPDPAVRRFFSHWNTAMCEWVASGFDPEVRKAMPRGEH